MAADLNEKVNRYQGLLKKALEKAEFVPIDKSHMYATANDFYTMAKAYYDDGVHFVKVNDPVNALACFSYGHAWLDAGARLGVFIVDDDELFTI